MIIERIIFKSIIEEQNSFRTNLQSWSGAWDHQFEFVFFYLDYPNLWFWKKAFVFITKYVFIVFLPMGHVNFRKM